MSKLVKLLASIFFIKQIKAYFIRKNGVSKVAFFTNFPLENAGTNYRVTKWQEIFNQQTTLKVDAFLTIKSKEKFDKYFSSDLYFLFAINMLLKTFFFSFISLRYDAIIVRREMMMFNDYGNLFMEKMLLSLHPNVILDFDDDISASKNEPRKIKSLFGKLMLENGLKFTESLAIYKRFVVGSEYLRQFVLKRNKNADVVVIPTCVDYDLFPSKKYTANSSTTVIGWIGGDYNLNYVDDILPDLNKIAEQYPIQLLVISGKGYYPDLTNLKFGIINKKWSLATEKDDIKLMDIGLMPLNDTRVSRGKCGFKLIQYMGLGVVSIASAVTANIEIVDNEINGFLVSNNQWYKNLEKVLLQKNQFSTIGEAAKQKIKMAYSFSGNLKKYESFLRKTI